MHELLKVGIIGFTGYKTLKCFGKKDYGDIVIGTTALYIGLNVCIKFSEWYNTFMNCELIQLLQKIF